MPLDDFQKAVTAVVSRNRSDGSPFAGGAVIQQHGFRLSDDQDIFTDDGDRLDRLVAADRAVLEAEGYTVRETRSYAGFRECAVMKPMVGTTVLQWTAALGREFYAPVPDPLFGRRLHFADLATNKALAAAGRMMKRDFVDLWMLDRHVMPLWRIACAAPGKDAGLNPFSLIEDAALNWSDGVDAPSKRRHIAPEKTPDELRVETERRASVKQVSTVAHRHFKESFSAARSVRRRRAGLQEEAVAERVPAVPRGPAAVPGGDGGVRRGPPLGPAGDRARP